jgi:hypothetical protein
MRWRSESWGTKLARLEQWHRWFAWHPVRIGEELLWLESVERLGKSHGGYYPFWTWEYREAK